ncbi:predicted protein [Chaetomium globosum CBS 148.51]|uniref:Ecp2 effector protein domain-containing protein n=1 Tax=Chaetomium globosum (strain ATCC 6205 / CBS 148.51 / DSM 1962 / NBRC 6347 / NRRL 1970) TaxID=306901 RepID=Q2H9P4_CHAGB|nr:uncharacterized protein CHGG_03060 [Chaetomium globosum CBS 148.51]EAQ91125.1 predicted protein [Chaetomium globosum CBS 148.51]
MTFTNLRSIALTSVLAAAAVAPPAAKDSPIEGYTIAPATWEFNGPDGQTVQLNGTAQEVVAQFDVLVPNSRAQLIASITAASTSTSRHDENSLLEKCYDETKLHCWVGHWDYARLSAIQDGIDYLNGVPGRPWHNPRPSTCARVSCSYGSAIYWCNDNRSRKELNSYQNIAHGADRIKNTCHEIFPSMTLTQGQIFYKDNWNVIVRGDDC